MSHLTRHALIYFLHGYSIGSIIIGSLLITQGNTHPATVIQFIVAGIIETAVIPVLRKETS